MFNLLQKYSSKLVIFTLCVIFISACVQKNKYNKHEKILPDTKMVSVLEDVLLMESYVNEKLQGVNTDSTAAVKRSFYKDIFKKHNIDSSSYYGTMYYLQAHPLEFDSLLAKVDRELNVVVAKDTSKIHPKLTPSGLPAGNVIDQEKELKERFGKHFPALSKREKNKEKESE